MEGIQHRWDCPANTGDPIVNFHIYIVADAVFTHADGSRTWHSHCKDCGRAAIINKPKETK